MISEQTIGLDQAKDSSVTFGAEAAFTLADWLADCQYDPASHWFIPSTLPCPDIPVMRRVLEIYDPEVTHGHDPLDLLAAFIEASRRAAVRSNYSLGERVRSMLAHFDREAGNYVSGGLEALGAKRADLFDPRNLWFVRGALIEIYANVKAFLEESGFLDTVDGPKKKVIIVHGRYRTGSTLVYNAIRGLLEAAGESVRSRGSDWAHVDRLIKDFQDGAYSGHWLLLKTHNWFPRQHSADVIPIFTRRNLADVAASSLGLWERNAKIRTLANTRARHFNALGIITEVENQKFLNDFVASDERTHVIDYELYRENIGGLVSNLGDLLGVGLTEKDIKKVSLAIDPERTWTRVSAMAEKVEETTLLRQTHLGDSMGRVGGLLHTLPRIVRERLRALGEWQFDPEPPHRNAVTHFEDRMMADMKWVDMITLTFDGSSDNALFIVTEDVFFRKLKDLLTTLQGDASLFVTKHQVVAGLIEQFVAIALGEKEYDASKRVEIARHVEYHSARIAGFSSTPLSYLTKGIKLNDPTIENLSEIEVSVKELIEHCSAIIGYSLDIQEEMAEASTEFSIIQSGGRNLFAHYLPKTIRDLKTESRTAVIEPWFFKSLAAVGDICEFGCSKGTLSIKLAAVLSALKVENKKVYAFDAFEGTRITDLGAGDDRIGGHSKSSDAFAELSKWAGFLPVIPVKGDPARTCLSLRRPVSFVWLNLDMAALLGPVLDGLWRHLDEDSIIGIDDIGRPEAPSVTAWVEQLLSEGRLNQLAVYQDDHIGFYQINSAWTLPGEEGQSEQEL